mmetsp:Transcript_16359/g.44990  ORF Transcript_16359/g.44990 Transcript_16359/m.44990 type:complete len:290 (-) Transcript_16359:308-1177(-)
MSSSPTTTATDKNDETTSSLSSQLLPLLRAELASELDAVAVTDEQLVPFLRWKPNVPRAAQRVRAFLSWKRDNPHLFDETLRLSQDDPLCRVLASRFIVAPPGLTTKPNHRNNNDKGGSPVLIGRLRNNDLRDGRTVDDVCRALFYTLDRLLETPASSEQGIVILHDLRRFSPSKNADLGIPKTLFGALFGHFPVRIKAIYLLNAPFFFHAFFQMMSTLLFPAKVKARCKFIKSLKEIEDVVDIDLLPQDVCGNADEFDVEAWMEEQKQRELNGTLVTMTTIGPRSSNE